MIEGEIRNGDKINLISYKKAQEIFSSEDDKPWVDMIQNQVGWGKPVVVERTDDDMFTIKGCAFKFNAVCFDTAQASRYSRLSGLYADKKN